MMLTATDYASTHIVRILANLQINVHVTRIQKFTRPSIVYEMTNALYVVVRVLRFVCILRILAPWIVKTTPTVTWYVPT